MQLSIPEEFRPGFAELRGLEEDQVVELVSVLNEVEPVRRRASLYTKVASETETIERPELDEILDTLISLSALRDDMSMSTSEFVRTISDVMDESGFEDLSFTEEDDRNFFEATLTQLLEIEPFEVASKALSLVYEQDHIVHGNFRVLTDMRPIFSSQFEEPSVRGAMVTYTLKFEYHDGSETRELFVALNSQQIDQLAEAVDRAKVKAEELKQFLDKSSIYYVESG